MDYIKTLETVKQYSLARIPFIAINSVEKGRTLDLLKEAYSTIKLPLFVHSMSKGLYDINTKQIVSEEKTVMGILDYISNEIRLKENMTYVFTEISEISNDSMVTRYFSDLVTLAEEKGASIIIITTDPIWAQLQRLGMAIKFSLPTEEEILKIINDTLEPYKNQISIEWEKNDFRDASTILSGISKIEIKNVIASLIAKQKITKNDLIELKFAKDKLFSNISGLEKIDLSNDNFNFAGLKNLRNWLIEKQQLLNPDKKDEMKERGIKPPRGILLVGVPGCGKSLSAKAIAHTWNLPLYRLDFATVQSKYVGQSEQQLREALDTAEHVSPCVLWIDEIEKGLGASDSSGTTTKMIGQFLFWLQECKKNVFVVATANDVSKLPVELLRRGRFDELFFIDLPNVNERRDIINMYVEKYLVVKLPDTLINELIRITDGFTASDIESAIRDIAYKLMATPNLQVNDQVLIQGINKVVPLSRTNPEQIQYIRNWGKNRAVNAS